MTYVDELGLVSVSGHTQSQLLELRHPESLGGNAFLGEQESTKNRYFQAFAPSAWRIAAFDLSSDCTEVTILEGADSRGDQRRVRTFDIKSADETQQWTVHSLGHIESDRETSPRQGVFVGHSGVNATLGIPGFPFLLTKEGFCPTRGLQMPVVETTPKRDDAQAVHWKFSSSGSDNAAFPFLQPCVTLHLPRLLSLIHI